MALLQKLINVYLKAAFVCGGRHAHPNVNVLHPPIDSVLLDGLIVKNVGSLGSRWRYYATFRWSTFDSDIYEAAIVDFRAVLPNGQALWASEEFWRGYQ